MNKEEIERIALEVAKGIQVPLMPEGTAYFVTADLAIEICTRFLSRIDTERGKDAVARVNSDGFIVETGDIPLAPGQQLFLSAPPIPADFSLYLEPALISSEHAKWEAATILADDDPSYDTFCGGWKAAFKLLAAAQGERK